MSSALVEIDALEALVIVDNDLDLMSPPAPGPVKVSRLLGEIGLTSPYHVHDRAEATKEFRLEDVCCSAHGLSVLLAACSRPIQMIKEAKTKKGSSSDDLVVDLHPSRPDYRGIRMPSEIVSLEADPTFEEIEQAGAKVEKHSEAHTVLDNMFLISGEIPRETEYEIGLKFGVRFHKDSGKWESDELINDERFLACNIKGKGIVVFSGCSHAGIVNATRHAVDLVGKGNPVYAVFGGYHLSMSEKAHLDATVQDLKLLDPKVLLPGHCSGWRVKFEIEKEMPGRLVPSSVGFRLAF
ncbi:metallo-beta-lactamase domain-containing protein [Histoplasma capsulatum H143]|uniref:Metallo-beta-lactamase domain-containing protein n=1 Tax=Ajellomyces capsulatus (strain H143) TaxID=544712 RepID=C6HHG4_AJECH|nr:metallo-beta-lactamase domain-containing protein [Histoplasma capsulatum H143]